jgi:glycosyltransferase involved in cell wall biosynthesis
VVGTDVGDTRDLIEDGINGYLVEVGDIRGAVRAIEGLLTDEKLWKGMSTNARQSARDFVTFNTLDRAVEQWRHILSRIELI